MVTIRCNFVQLTSDKNNQQGYTHLDFTINEHTAVGARQELDYLSRWIPGLKGLVTESGRE